MHNVMEKDVGYHCHPGNGPCPNAAVNTSGGQADTLLKVYEQIVEPHPRTHVMVTLVLVLLDPSPKVTIYFIPVPDLCVSECLNKQNMRHICTEPNFLATGSIARVVSGFVVPEEITVSRHDQ